LAQVDLLQWHTEELQYSLTPRLLSVQLRRSSVTTESLHKLGLRKLGANLLKNLAGDTRGPPLAVVPPEQVLAGQRLNRTQQERVWAEL
jgi:hypothetical protein